MGGACCPPGGAGAECCRTDSRSGSPIAPYHPAHVVGVRWVQIGAMVLPALAFASYLAVAFGAALARRVRGRPYEALEGTTLRVRRWARWLASAGLATILGFVCYFGLLVVTAASAVGPVVAGCPIPWLALQVLSMATSAFTVLIAGAWRSSPKALTGPDRAQTGALLADGTVFAAWPAYWGLLSP